MNAQDAEVTGAPPRRTPARRKARQLARHLRGERPDYAYLKEVFRHLRAELGIEVAQAPKTLPYVPTENEIRRYYQTVWTARRSGDIVLIKTLLYTGVRVAELVSIRLGDVDLDACRIRITHGKGGKDRVSPSPPPSKRPSPCTSAPPGTTARPSCSSLHGKSRTPPAASAPCSPDTPPRPDWRTTCRPHRLRHFLFTWLKTQGIDDALIQPYSGHATRTSLEIYSRLALADAQHTYDSVIDRVPRLKITPVCGW